MEIEIKSAKLVKREFLELTYEKTEGEGQNKRTFTCTEKHKAEVHQDLRNSFKSLAVHFGFLGEFIAIKPIDKVAEAETERLHVTGYSVGGKEDDLGIMLSGHKILKTGKAMIINTPFTRFEEDDQSKYKYMSDLQEKIELLEQEIEAFLFEGKKAAPKQPELEFQEALN